MPLKTNLTQLCAAATLTLLASCGGSGADADSDPYALIQAGDMKGAISILEPQISAATKGSDEHKELVLQYVEALAQDSPDKAKDEFVSMLTNHKDAMTAKDAQYIVNRLADKGHLTQAIDIMDQGKKAWPEEAIMETVLAELKKAVASSGNDAAVAKLKSMGYL